MIAWQDDWNRRHACAVFTAALQSVPTSQIAQSTPLDLYQRRPESLRHRPLVNFVSGIDWYSSSTMIGGHHPSCHGHCRLCHLQCLGHTAISQGCLLNFFVGPSSPSLCLTRLYIANRRSGSPGSGASKSSQASLLSAHPSFQPFGFDITPHALLPPLVDCTPLHRKCFQLLWQKMP